MRLRVVAGVALVWFLALAPSALAAPPTPFTLISPAADAVLDDSTVPTLTWSRSTSDAGPIRYEVLVTGTSSGFLDDADCAAECSFTPGALGPGRFDWQVVARNADGSVATERRLVDRARKIVSVQIADPWGVWHPVGAEVPVLHHENCPRVRGTSDPPGAVFQYTVDGHPEELETRNIRLPDCHLAAGLHTVGVRAGGEGRAFATASFVFRTDLVHPSVRIEGPTRVAKGTTVTFRAVADPTTATGPVTFKWSESSLALGTGAELRLPAMFDAADLAVTADDAEGDMGSAQLHVETGPKPPRGTVGVRAPRHLDRRRATLKVVWPAGARTVTLTEGARKQTVPVSRSIRWTFSGAGRRAVRARFDWPLPARAYTTRVVVRKRGSLNHRT